MTKLKNIPVYGLPKWAEALKVQHDLFNGEISKTKLILGHQKTEELLEKLKTEAITVPYMVNSDYIIRKLQQARSNYKIEFANGYKIELPKESKASSISEIGKYY